MVILHILRRHLLQYPGRALAALVVLALALTLMLALSGVGAALQFRLGPRLAELFPEERVRLEPGRTALGPLQIEGRPLTDQVITSLRTLEGVADLYPVEAIRFPVRIEGQLFGSMLSSDVVIHGVPRELVEDAIAARTPWRIPESGEPWPVVASSYFLDLYNLGMARSAGLPLISAGYVIGRDFKVVLGESTIGLGRTQEQVRFLNARVVGLTAQPALLGLAMPADVVRSLNELYAPGQDRHYVQVVAQLVSTADRETFLAAARGLGLHPSRQEMLGSQLKLVVRLAGVALITLAVGIFALGMLNFYQFFSMTFHARRIDLIRLHALGMTPMQSVILAMAEVAVLAGGAMVVAMALNHALGLMLARLAKPWLERLATLPPDLFSPSPLWLLSSGFLILILTMLPALPMLRRVVRVEPGQVIRDL